MSLNTLYGSKGSKGSDELNFKKLIQGYLGTELEKIHTIAIAKANSIDNTKMTCTIEILQFLTFRKELKEMPKIYNIPLTQPLWGSRFVIKAPFAKDDKFIIGFSEADIYAAISSNDVRKQETKRRYSLDDILILGYLPKNNFDRIKEFEEDLLLMDRETGHHIRIGDGGINIKGDTKCKGNMDVEGELNVTKVITCENLMTTEGVDLNAFKEAYDLHLQNMH